MKTFTDLFRFGVESYTAEHLTNEVRADLVARGKKCTGVIFNVELTDGIITDKRVVY